MKFDAYTLKARVLPAVLTVIPFFTLHYFLFSPTLGVFWSSLIELKVVTDITLLGAGFFLLMQFNRIVAKEVFEKRMYNNGLRFPTTNMLLHKDSYFSQSYKKKIHHKIQIDFKMHIPSVQIEQKDEHQSRQSIAEAVSHIRAKVGSGVLLNQHNAEYGFVRNFTGGTLVATLISALDIIIFAWMYPNLQAQMISIFMTVVYLSLTLLSKTMIDSIGRSYAKVLIQEYMAR